MGKSRKTDREKKSELLSEGSILSANYNHSKKTRQIIEWFREGLTDKEIFIKILQENPKLKESSATVYLNSARASFKEEFILDRRFNIIQHVKRYDKDILFLSRFEPKTSSYAKYQLEKTQAYLDMINLLQKKERVLGFHKKSNKIKIKNNFNITIPKTIKSFDFSELSFDEKLELYNFILMCKTDPNEKLTLTPNKQKQLRESIETIDVEHEEIIEEDINIDSITEKEEKPLQIDLTHLEVKKDKNIIDTVGDKDKGSDLESIKNKLLGNLLK